MERKYKVRYSLYFLAVLSIVPVSVQAQSEVSGTTAFLTFGAFIACLIAFFFLLRLQAGSGDQVPGSKPEHKGKPAPDRHRHVP